MNGLSGANGADPNGNGAGLTGGVNGSGAGPTGNAPGTHGGSGAGGADTGGADTGGAGDGAGPNGGRPRRDPRLRAIRNLTLWSIVLFKVCMAFVLLMESVATAEEHPWRTLGTLPLALVVIASVAPLSLAHLKEKHSLPPWWYWGGLGCLVALVLLSPASLLPLYAVAMWGSVSVLLLRPRRAVLLAVLLAALPWAGLLTLPGAHDLGFYGLYAVAWALAFVFAALLTSGWLMAFWLWEIVHDVVYGQDARSRLAVIEERLRFSRDMHDLLGHSLSALAAKSELASRLAERAPERAAVEIAEVRALARDSLSQVRSAVRGYREVGLAEEVENVRGVLAANGVRVVVEGLDGVDPSPEAAALAAWVVREGGTNVLRHSEAGECRITFLRARETTVGPEALVVEMVNDRSRPDTGPEGGSGSGLTGLRERVALGGGTLSASHTRGGGFLLRLVVPG